MTGLDEGDAERVARVLDLICARTQLAGLRVLDLACRTGVFATNLADLGADVLAIEGRQANLDERPPSSARYVMGDVRTLNREDHGWHDVTLCLGILYHLDPDDAYTLLLAMRDVTRRFAIVDTHTGPDTDRVEIAKVEYRGRWYDEPDSPWASIGNPRSWWFTEASLHAVAVDAGWSTVEPVPGPAWPGEEPDRRWLVLS